MTIVVFDASFTQKWFSYALILMYLCAFMWGVGYTKLQHLGHQTFPLQVDVLALPW
jgi:hypothetical protein